MSLIGDYLIPTTMILGVSLLSAFSVRTQTFSADTFLTAMIIGMSALIWLQIYPMFMVVIPIFILIGLLYRKSETVRSVIGTAKEQVRAASPTVRMGAERATEKVKSIPSTISDKAKGISYKTKGISPSQLIEKAKLSRGKR